MDIHFVRRASPAIFALDSPKPPLRSFTRSRTRPYRKALQASRTGKPGGIESPQEGGGVHECVHRAPACRREGRVVDVERGLGVVVVEMEQRKMPGEVDMQRRISRPVLMRPAEPVDSFARSALHLAELFRLADRAGLLANPELATKRMKALLGLRGIEA